MLVHQTDKTGDQPEDLQQKLIKIGRLILGGHGLYHSQTARAMDAWDVTELPHSTSRPV